MCAALAAVAVACSHDDAAPAQPARGATPHVASAPRAASAPPAPPAPPAHGAPAAAPVASASASAAASAGAAPSAHQRVTTAVGHGKGPAVALIDAGAEPRRQLVYVFKKGRRDRVRVTSSTALTLAVGGKTLPTPSMPDVRMLGDVRVLSVGAAGDAWRKLLIDAVELLPPPGSPPLPAALTDSLGSIRGLGGHDRVQPNGLVSSMELDTRHVQDPQLQQLLASLQAALGQMSAPFPDEAVGVGGRWKVSTRVTEQGMPFRQEATYRLESLDGDRGKAHIDIVQHADKGHVALPGVPPGVDTTLLGMSSTGNGEVEFDLGHSVQRGHIAVETTVDVRIAAEGQTHDAHMVMKLATRFEPAAAKSAKK